MSYCRFSNGDVYLYDDVYKGLTCCACKLADRKPTIFTTGGTFITKSIKPCEHCNGLGCEKCMLRGTTQLENEQDAIDHLQAHRAAGHDVPQYAIDRLRAEVKAGSC